MVALDVTETSKALAVSGGYITLFGLISYFLKERLYISEATLATCTGIIFGPLAANVFTPGTWASDTGSVVGNDALNDLTFQITRIVIGIQVLFTGIALPKAYLRREWISLVTLLGPIMISAWFVTSLLIWGLIPGLNFLECLVVGACVTPTDPVLANSICKGRS
jgi:NhaP-type Na+/H+ or K+/H+ antiporter